MAARTPRGQTVAHQDGPNSVELREHIDTHVNSDDGDFTTASHHLQQRGVSSLSIMRALLPAVQKLNQSGKVAIGRLNLLQDVIQTESVKNNYNCGPPREDHPIKPSKSWKRTRPQRTSQVGTCKLDKQQRARIVLDAYYTSHPLPTELAGRPFPEVSQVDDLFDQVLNNTGHERSQLKRSYCSMAAACEQSRQMGSRLQANSKPSWHGAKAPSTAPAPKLSTADRRDQEAFLNFVSQQ